MSIFSSSWFWPIVNMLGTWAACYLCYRLGRIRGRVSTQIEITPVLTKMHSIIMYQAHQLKVAEAHLNHAKAKASNASA